MVEYTRLYFSHLTFRGVHQCSLCAANGQGVGSVGWSQENLIVPGTGEVFAAPGGVVHYIADHEYLPPAAFITSAMNCPSIGSQAYFDALRVANNGTPVPMETSEQFSARIRSAADAAVSFRRELGAPLKQATRTQVIAAARTVWPDKVFSENAESVEVGGIRVRFDQMGRVVEVV